MRRLFHLLGTLVATVSLSCGPSTFAASTAPGPRSSYGITVLGDSTQTPPYLELLNNTNLILDDTDMLSAWTIEFKHGGENGVLGLTHSRRRHIEIFVDNPDDIDALRAPVEEAAQRQIFLTDWRQRNQTFFSALQVERNVMFMILTLIVLVAALNIISGLIMLVKDKSHDIAILRTMGATRGAVLRIFLMTGAAIGVTGTIAGVLLGVVICLNVESIRQFFSWLSGTVLFNPELYFLSQLPAKMDFSETVSVILMALGLSFLATLVPAWRAAKLDPVEALRYE